MRGPTHQTRAATDCGPPFADLETAPSLRGPTSWYVLERRSSAHRTMPYMWPHAFEPCHDLSAAEWIGPRLLAWGTENGTPVTGIVPVGFDAYVRVFHPAGAPAPSETVTWQEIAHWSGRRFHPLAQFERMSLPARPLWGPSPFDQAPFRGTLIPAACDVLVQQLAGLTTTPSVCYFALWEGWGVLSGGWSMLKAVHHSDDEPDAIEAEIVEFQRQVALLPRFEHPHRSYLLGRGRIGVACDLYRQPLGPYSWPRLGLTPQLWWPADRAWVVATDIDFDSTIVATTNAGAEALLNGEGLEALPVPSDGRLDLDGDLVNLPQ